MARSRKTTRNTKDKGAETEGAGDAVESVGKDALDLSADESVDGDAKTSSEDQKEDVIEDAEFTDLPKEETPEDQESGVQPLEEADSIEAQSEADIGEAGEALSSEEASEGSDGGEAAEVPADADSEVIEVSSDDVISDPKDDQTEDQPVEPAAIVPTQPPPDNTPAFASVLPLLAGGLIAGAIGFFAGRYYDAANAPEVVGPTPDENAAALSEQTARLDSLEASLAEVSARDIGGEIDEAVAPVGVAVTDVSTRIDGLSGALSSLSERVETIALRPTATGIEADEFDDALSEFRTQLQSTIDQAQAEIDKARTQAETISEQAFAAEQSALVRSAWSQIETALQSGAPYREPLDELSSVLDTPVPELLASSADTGVVQLATLQQEFPPAAREALDASIRTTSSDGNAVDKFTSFLRVQAGVRSLAPREGDDPDAVLSRAEAALMSGDVSTALEEVQALPEAGQGALTDWTSAARMRLDVLGAASDFAATLQ